MTKSDLTKLQAEARARVCKLRAATLLKKETLAQVFFCEVCEISKNTFSDRTLPVVTSGCIAISLLPVIEIIFY